MATQTLSRSLLSKPTKTLTSLSLMFSRSFSSPPSLSKASNSLSTSFLLNRVRPLTAVFSAGICGVGPRALSTRATSSSLNDPSPNWSNRPPKETILLDGCDFEHWLVVVEKPEGEPTRDEIIDSYIKTLAMVVGSEEEARKKIYSVSTRCYFAFGALVSEELSYKLKELPKVRWVLPDSYLDVRNKDYGGEPFIDGKAVPYDPKYHEEWIKNNARANERNRRNDRPRNFDRSRNFDRRRENMRANQGMQNSGPNAGMPPSNVGGPNNTGGMPPSNVGGPNNTGGMPPSNVGGPNNTGGMPPSNTGPNNYGGMPPSNTGPNNYGGMPPSNTGPNNYGGMPLSNTGPNNYGGMPPSNTVPNNYGGMPPSNTGPNNYGGMPPSNTGPNNMGGMPPNNMGRMPPNTGGMQPHSSGVPSSNMGGMQPNSSGVPPNNMGGMPPNNNIGGMPPNMGRMPSNNTGGMPPNAGWSGNMHQNFQPNSGDMPYQGQAAMPNTQYQTNYSPNRDE